MQERQKGSVETASYNRLETPFYACLRDICHALEHRSVLLRQIEVVAVVSELIGADSDELTIQIIENDKRLAVLREYAQTA